MTNSLSSAEEERQKALQDGETPDTTPERKGDTFSGESLFREMAENVPDVFWVTPPDLSVIEYVNPAYERIWGRSVASLYAHPHQWMEAILREDRERVIAAFSALRDCKAGVDIEYRIAREDGAVRWIHDRRFQMRDAPPNSTRVTGIAQDITERKHAEEELRIARTQMEQLLAKSPAMIYRLKVDGENLIPLMASGNTSALLGFEAAESLGSEWWLDRLHPDNREAAVASVSETLSRGESRTEYQLRHNNGSYRWVDDNRRLLRDASGEPVELVGAWTDITERKNAEAIIHRQQIEMRALFDLIPAMIWFKDTKNSILRVNKHAAEFIGRSVEQIEGRACREIFPQEADGFYASDLELIQSGAAKLGIVEALRNRDGVEMWVRTNKVPYKNSEGKVIGIVVVAEDITDQKRAEEALRLVETRLFQSQKMETVGELAGGIAHEFNNIMTSIMGQSELLLGDLPAGSSLAENATEIREAAERAANLTRQLLAYGRRQILLPEVLDLNAVLAGMGTVLRHLAGRAVRLDVIPAPDLKNVNVDAGQLEQVIMNVVMNATDAMPNGGKLTLATENATLGPEYASRFSEFKPGKYVMLTITDTGVGMSEAIKARIFEPFFSTRAVGQGTGLGLATCYGILKQSGGHITVDSEPGRGATFRIYLPQVHSVAKAPARGLYGPHMPHGGETILLVEDDPALREMAASLLGRLGYTVLTAADGTEALSLPQVRERERIDLLVTDAGSPRMSGKELSGRILSFYPMAITLFISVYLERSIVRHGVLDEGVAILRKPFTPSALAMKVREILDQKTDNPSDGAA